MPIYEYECTKCGKTFEKFQKMADNPLRECRFCKGPLQKLISNCSFQLKGTGWYVTDYKKPVETAGKKKEKKEEGTETTTEVKSGSATESKTEAKAETKAEPKTETKTETKSTEKAGG